MSSVVFKNIRKKLLSQQENSNTY